MLISYIRVIYFILFFPATLVIFPLSVLEYLEVLELPVTFWLPGKLKCFEAK